MLLRCFAPEKLWLQNNEFVGAIPNTVGSLTNLGEYSLMYFHGRKQLLPFTSEHFDPILVPDWLNLESNNLSGNIPSTIGLLASLGEALSCCEQRAYCAPREFVCLTASSVNSPLSEQKS